MPEVPRIRPAAGKDGAAATPPRAAASPVPVSVPAPLGPPPRAPVVLVADGARPLRPEQPRRAPRDARLDVFRGLALVMIFVNHVPGNPLEHWTSRNFGFSDAAEGFVFMSGVAAGLAYSARFRARPIWPAVARVWSRAWSLYLVHLAVTLMALAVSAWVAIGLGVPALVEANNVAPVMAMPAAAMIGLPTLLHQLGYMNILPVYVLLLLAAPLAIGAGLRHPWGLVAASAGLWFLAGSFRLNLPTWPVAGEWFFNPLSWQLLFVIGLVTGIAAKQGRALVPRSRGLLFLSGAVLTLVAIWASWDRFGAGLDARMFALRDSGIPAFLADYDKAYLSLPRLGHVLALAYAVASLDPVRRAAAHRLAAPLALIGRHGLAVFALGTVLAFVAQGLLASVPQSAALAGAIVLAGIALHWGFAWLREASSRAVARG